ncbi:MAG: glycosyltransferase [Lachnospiraceae bacterium]|nr:glycosyltransferase [Lachnospiraceae bacterium]
MMGTALLSFIIPACNAEHTLASAVKSIGESPRVEIIIVENGCTDRTRETADALSDADNRIRVLHSDRGVSCARNVGLDCAEGRWLAFLDADDAMLPGGTETMLNDAENDVADVILYGHCAGDVKRLTTETERGFSGAEYDHGRAEVIADPTKYMQVWAKLFRNDIIVKNQLRFNPLLRLSEDSDFTLRFLKEADSMVLSPKAVYQYTLNANSTMHRFDGAKVKDYVTAMYESRKAVEEDTQEIRDAFQKYVLMHLNILMVREVFARNNPASYRQKRTTEREICREPVFREALQTVTLSDCRNAKLLPAYLLKKRCFGLAAAVFMARAGQNAARERKQSDV